MAKPKPLPCPFCGGHYFYVGPVSSTERAVICERCGARSRAFGLPDNNPEEKSIARLFAEAERQAIEAWNRRVM